MARAVAQGGGAHGGTEVDFAGQIGVDTATCRVNGARFRALQACTPLR